MIDEYAQDNADTSALYDVARIESVLHAAAHKGRWLSYSEMLYSLGFRFSRPKMRVLCKTLAVVDQRAAAAGAPELAVLVVRQSDGLPGQGWWMDRTDYTGQWTGTEAEAFVRALQAQAFVYWRTQAHD